MKPITKPWMIFSVLLTVLLGCSQEIIVSNQASFFVSKGPINGASCSLLDAVSGQRIATDVKTVNGVGTAELGKDYHGTFYAQCKGGTYKDEYTAKMVDASNLVMHGVGVSNGLGTDFVVSALTDLAYRLAKDNLAQQYTDKAVQVAKALGIDSVDIARHNLASSSTKAASTDEVDPYHFLLVILSVMSVGDDGQPSVTKLVKVIRELESDLSDNGKLDENFDRFLDASVVASKFLVGSNRLSDSMEKKLAPGLSAQTPLFFKEPRIVKALSDVNLQVSVQGGSGTGALSYTSSNPSVAEVYANGAIQLKQAGTVIIYARKSKDSSYWSSEASFELVIRAAEQTAFSMGSDRVFTYRPNLFHHQAAIWVLGSGTTTYNSSKRDVATVGWTAVDVLLF